MENRLLIIYDYDGTLAPGSIQEPKLIPLIMPELKDNPSSFWKLPNQKANSGGLDGNIMYMNVILQKAQEKDIRLTRPILKECGSYSINFPGVLTWFKRLNEYGKSKNVTVEHYIISSGNEELLVGTKIAPYFKKIHACKFYFNDEGIATEVGSTLNDHTKTKFIEEVRGDDDDNEAAKVPYQNMIYIGDGFTDLPAMKLITGKGGLAFAVYSDEKHRQLMAQYIEKSVISLLEPTKTCYKKGSVLEHRITREIDRISRSGESEYKQLTIFDFLD